MAKKFIGEITFTIGHYGDYDRQVGDWNFPRTQDICVILQAEKKQTFKMMDTFSVENLEKFVNEYKDGALKPYIKSEPLPIGNKKPVKVCQYSVSCVFVFFFIFLKAVICDLSNES